MEKPFTFQEVLDLLRISKATLLRLIKKEEMGAYKVGGKWFFDKEEFTRWLENKKKRR